MKALARKVTWRMRCDGPCHGKGDGQKVDQQKMSEEGVGLSEGQQAGQWRGRKRE